MKTNRVAIVGKGLSQAVGPPRSLVPRPLFANGSFDYYRWRNGLPLHEGRASDATDEKEEEWELRAKAPTVIPTAAHVGHQRPPDGKILLEISKCQTET